MLNVQSLTTYFYTMRGCVRAVDGISLVINENEAVGLVGESGCGKTMTAFSIMRLVPFPGKIVDGKISFKNTDLLTLTENKMAQEIRGKEISMIFQDPLTFLNPVMRVGDQVAESIMTHLNVEKDEATQRVIELLGAVGLSPEITRSYPHELSGGMRQRILMAIALSCNPSLLIADEPTTALDVTVQAQILDLLKELMSQLEISLLLITHDLGIVASICDKVYIMYAGKIVEHADVFSLYETPFHPYTKGLLECALSIDELKTTIVSIEGRVPDMCDPPPGCRFHPRCPEARQICREQESPLIEVESGHTVGCWLYA